VGRLESTNQLALAIGLPLRNPGAFQNLLRELYDPVSPNFHRYLTPRQFTEKFGPTEKDYQTVIEYVRRNGFTVTAEHAGRMVLEASATAGEVEKAFGVRMMTYRHPTENRRFFAPDSEPSAPAEIPILDISGLDDYSRPRPLLSRIVPLDGRGNPQPEYWTGEGPDSTYIPADFKAAYASDVSADGTGQSVGLLEFDTCYPADIRAYENMENLPSPRLHEVGLPGAGGRPGKYNDEVALDVEMAVGMAPGLSSVILYEAPLEGSSGGYGSLFNSLLIRMAEDDAAGQLSSSWNPPSGPSLTRDQIFQQMAAQGQSFFQASGDYGAYTNGVYQQADNPYITIVGGTGLWIEMWSYSSPGVYRQYPGYGAEWVWNGGSSNNVSGGGISASYLIPSWQEGIDMSANGGSRHWRNSPDVAMFADGAFAIFDDGKQGGLSGTSVAAPLWAGFTALINQQAAANGLPNVGFLNPAIYTIGMGTNYDACFHDITSGNNTTAASPNRFYAVPGYDLCTGWGTPGGQALLDVLTVQRSALVVFPSAGFSATGLVGGPFDTNAGSFSVANIGCVPVEWSVGNIPSWLEVSTNGGTIPPNGPAILLTISLSSLAASLGPGSYTATLVFTNLTQGAEQSLQFVLNVLEYGSLQVTLGPPAAIHAGAAWQVDGGPWMNSGDTVSQLTATTHTVGFSTIFGWATPSNQTAVISAGQTTTNAGIYAELYRFTTIAGRAGTNGSVDGTNGDALFFSPNGITVDTNGNVFVADTGNDVIRELTPQGTNWVVTTIAGLAGNAGNSDGTNETALFNGPRGVAAAGAGILYVADTGNNIVRLLTGQGTNWVVNTFAQQAGHYGFTGGTPYYFSDFPCGITVDGNGNVWETDLWFYSDMNVLSHSGSAWALSTFMGYYEPLGFGSPHGVALLPGNVPYVVDTANNDILTLVYGNSPYYFPSYATAVVAGSGAAGSADGLAAQAQFSAPEGIATDPMGNVYVADTGNDAIRQLMPFVSSLSGALDYQVVTIGGSAANAGSADGTNDTARFNSPAGLVVDAKGNVFVADTGNQTIRMGSPLFPWVQVLANPNVAAVQGAQFQIDGGSWQSVGSIVHVLPGEHTISFGTVFGWITPSNQTVALNSGQTFTGVYIEQLASLEVSLGSPAAIAAGARWQLDGGDWQQSGATLSGLLWGWHTLAFTNTPNWIAPTNQNVFLDSVTNALSVAYAPVESNKPALSIISPKAGQKWTNQVLTLSGAATDNFAVASVWYQINGGGWNQALGTNAWQSAPMALAPGTVTAQAYAMNASGNCSKTNTVRFVNAPTAPLTITFSGLGTVSPNLSGQFLAVGREYILTARPASGFLFSNWTGDFPATTPALSFTLQTNTFLQVNFVPSPFLPIAGTYEGLFYDTNSVAQPSSGFFSAQLSGGGICSGSIRIEGESHGFSSRFSLEGAASNYIPRTFNPISMQLWLDLSDGTGITGELATPNWQAGLRAYRSPFSKARPAPEQGRYTLVFPAGDASSLLPGGNGFGAATVDASGNIRFTGTLGDGTAVSQSAIISQNGLWPFYISLYSGTGAILGWLAFTNSPTLDLEGSLTWMKRPQPGAAFYPYGFSMQAEAEGSAYNFTNGHRVLNFSRGQVWLAGGNLGAPFTNLVFLGTNNIVTNSSANPLAISISTASGLFHGSVVTPARNRSISFSGAVFQKQNAGYGIFPGTNQAGQVFFGPLQ
jgi:hypothetical protein